MDKDTALALLRQYADIAFDQGTSDPTITRIYERWPEDGSERKAMRWLGFMQGIMYARGFFTLEELKDHSRGGTVISPKLQP
jgi:hypothetical protein